jgi:lipid-A-disaccharide synthase-like uncharacterized protein
MKFWKLLGCLCTVVFLIFLLVSWLAADRHLSPAPPLRDEPARAPEFH